MKGQVETLMSVGETAATLGVSTKTVRRMIGRREIVTVTVGRRTMVEPTDLRAFIDAHKTPANDDGPGATGPLVQTSAEAGGGDDAA